MPNKAPPAVTQELAKTGLSATHAGAVVDERYRLGKPLGRGGMGIVYAALHLHTQRNVALKLIHCAWDDETLELYRRFLGEARAATAVRHRNVVDVLDMGYHGGVPFLVMERLVGESLEQVLDRLEVLSLSLLLEWLLPVMGALAVLHDKGIVHRDIKPSNIFLARDEAARVVPKLLDFGLARRTSDAPLTAPGVMLGTPDYMAPERARGQEVGPLADVWAMGIVLFECLSGKLPFTATNLNAMAAQIVAGEVLKLNDVNPQVPEAVAAVVDRALSLAPEHRHPDMASFAYALAGAAQRSGANLPEDPDPVGLPNFGALHVRGSAWASGPLVLNVGENAGPRVEAVASATSTQHPRPKARGAVGVLLAVALVLSFAGAASWMRRERAAEVRPAPAPPAAHAAHESSPAAAPTGAASAPSTLEKLPAIAPMAPAPVSSPLARPRARFEEQPAVLETRPRRPLPAASASTEGPVVLETRPRRPLSTASTSTSPPKSLPPLNGGARAADHSAPSSAPVSANEFEKEWM